VLSHMVTNNISLKHAKGHEIEDSQLLRICAGSVKSSAAEKNQSSGSRSLANRWWLGKHGDIVPRARLQRAIC